MNGSSVADNLIQQRFDAILQRLTEQVRLRIPGVECRIHHGANDHFAWWVVARLRIPAYEDKIVDVSVECRSMEPVIDIRTDLAREDGTVLQEHAEIRQVGPINGESLDESLRAVESFLFSQVDCLVAELS